MDTKTVKMIVPVENGFILMPFSTELLMSLKDKYRDGVEVAPDANTLAELVREVYSDPA